MWPKHKFWKYSLNVILMWSQCCLLACLLSKLLQSCPTLCDPTDCSPPGSPVHGILQARILVWVAMLPPGDLDPGIESASLISPALRMDSLLLSHRGSPQPGLHVCAKLHQSYLTVWPNGLQPARLLCLWDSPGMNTGVGCCALLQGIFPT